MKGSPETRVGAGPAPVDTEARQETKTWVTPVVTEFSVTDATQGSLGFVLDGGAYS